MPGPLSGAAAVTGGAAARAADRYALIGCPVEHSISPQIHARFAAQTGEAVRYELLEAPRDGFADAVRRFAGDGGKGLNVTLPFKEEARRLADDVSARAQAAGAVNTLVLRAARGGGAGDGNHNNADGSANNRNDADAGGNAAFTLYGDNTDGAGFIRDLRVNCKLQPEGRAILLLGAGGAARGIIPPLMESGAASLVIANRGVERARTLERLFAPLGDVTACALDELGGRRFDGIVNATSASLAGEVPALPNAPGAAWGYDLAYDATGDTAFVRWLRAHGVEHAFDGLGMLVEQAAESFLLWRGVRPQTAAIIRALREQQ
ncbi:MAG: shikimate dehydrogenase [Gammaproteobacteria bacterium]|nr:shikimate dehydrogenase [Gammaproteobacteria bacterium]